MTFGRWLLVHSLSISILVMLGVGYYFKSELKLNEAYSQLLQIDSESISLTTNSSKTPTENLDEQEKQITESIVVEEKDPMEAAILTDQTNSNKSIEDSATELNTINEKQLTINNVAQPKDKKQDDYLLMAREAFWKQDYQLSIDNYLKEMDKTPKSPDLYGELGNLYFGLKNYELAANNYLEAGKLMIELDDQVRAKQMYEILLSLAPEKANDLLSIKNDKYQ